MVYKTAILVSILFVVIKNGQTLKCCEWDSDRPPNSTSCGPAGCNSDDPSQVCGISSQECNRSTANKKRDRLYELRPELEKSYDRNSNFKCFIYEEKESKIFLKGCLPEKLELCGGESRPKWDACKTCTNHNFCNSQQPLIYDMTNIIFALIFARFLAYCI